MILTDNRRPYPFTKDFHTQFIGFLPRCQDTQSSAVSDAGRITGSCKFRAPARKCRLEFLQRLCCHTRTDCVVLGDSLPSNFDWNNFIFINAFPLSLGDSIASY